jgi:hypothetical protein
MGGGGAIKREVSILLINTFIAFRKKMKRIIFNKSFVIKPKATAKKLLEDDMWRAFGKKRSGAGGFPAIRKLIQEYGEKWVGECYREMQKEGLKWDLLCWKITRANVRYE